MFILVLYVAVKRIEFGGMNARYILVGTLAVMALAHLLKMLGITLVILVGCVCSLCFYCTYNADIQGKGFTKFLSLMSWKVSNRDFVDWNILQFFTQKT